MINHKISHFDGDLYILFTQCTETGTAVQSVIHSWYTARDVIRLQNEHDQALETMSETDRNSGNTLIY